MIDSHCHLTDSRLHGQLDAVLTRAAAAGVTRFVTIGTDLEDAQAALILCRTHSNIRCAIGIHPNHAQPGDLERISLFRGLQANPSVLAVGEIGLDYFHKFVPLTLQRQLFEAQLQLAQDLSRPVVIHSREAVNDTLAVLRNFSTISAVFHCFTGTSDEARAILDAGHYIGFTGPITYKKNDALRQVVALVPLDRLLVETDAPYLSPEPVRSQKTNEPAFVMHTAAVVGQIKNLILPEIDRITTENTLRFYNWKQ
ncbi:MAG TPA: TatD family hydrolase [Tepidisphaeraceae bacterium]|jgi:TatD DNase family protein|nr:TatD family hydrolase [Tepidisphaeraceae bacterium]